MDSQGYCKQRNVNNNLLESDWFLNAHMYLLICP